MDLKNVNTAIFALSHFMKHIIIENNYNNTNTFLVPSPILNTSCSLIPLVRIRICEVDINVVRIYRKGT